VKRLRYYTEELAAHVNPHDVSQVSAIAVHCRTYHWVRIHTQLILGYAELPAAAFHLLVQGHDSIMLHPSLHDKTPVKVHANKHNNGKHAVHFEYLVSAIQASPTDTTADLVAKLVAAGHIFLSPDF
jgi:hypothetical protein